MGKVAYLLDTNVIIDFLGNKLPEQTLTFLIPIIDSIPNVSVITQIELLGFKTSNRHQKVLSNFVEDSKIYQLTGSVFTQTISLRKSKKIKLPDAIIAATAIENKLTLITRNVSDFKSIDHLEIKNPYHL